MFALCHIWLCSFVAEVGVEPNTTILDYLLLLDVRVNLFEINTLSADCLVDSTQLRILLVESLQLVLLQKFFLTADIGIGSTIPLV